MATCRIISAPTGTNHHSLHDAYTLTDPENESALTIFGCLQVTKPSAITFPKKYSASSSHHNMKTDGH